LHISIPIPEDVVHQIESKWKDIPRRILEALAIDAYRSGVITEVEVQSMLSMSSRFEVNDFLKRAQADIDYSEADLLHDIEAIRMLKSK